MTYYVMDKVGNKIYGPMETKQKAAEAIEEGVAVAEAALKALGQDKEIVKTEKLDELEVTYDGNVVALFEIITKDQMDNQDLIPPEHR